MSSRKKRISEPFNISALMLDASNSSSKSFIGLRLAYKPSSLRIFKRPCSGLTFKVGSLSYLGCPTAPNNIASQFFSLANVSSGNGLPVASMASCPMIASSNSNVCPNSFAMISNTFFPSVVTSLPMPSPGRITIFFFIPFC